MKKQIQNKSKEKKAKAREIPEEKENRAKELLLSYEKKGEIKSTQEKVEEEKEKIKENRDKLQEEIKELINAEPEEVDIKEVIKSQSNFKKAQLEMQQEEEGKNVKQLMKRYKDLDKLLEKKKNKSRELERENKEINARINVLEDKLEIEKGKGRKWMEKEFKPSEEAVEQFKAELDKTPSELKKKEETKEETEKKQEEKRKTGKKGKKIKKKSAKKKEKDRSSWWKFWK